MIVRLTRVVRTEGTQLHILPFYGTICCHFRPHNNILDIAVIRFNFRGTEDLLKIV